MSESAPLNDEQKLREGTETLQQLAEEVERERAEHGRSGLDGARLDVSDEQAMADAAATSADNPDVDNETREDHSPDTWAFNGNTGEVEPDPGAPGRRDQMPH